MGGKRKCVAVKGAEIGKKGETPQKDEHGQQFAKASRKGNAFCRSKGCPPCCWATDGRATLGRLVVGVA